MSWTGLVGSAINSEVVKNLAEKAARTVVGNVVKEVEEEIDKRTDNPAVEVAADYGLGRVEEKLEEIIDSKTGDTPSEARDRVLADIQKAKDGVKKIRSSYRVDPVERKVKLAENGKGQVGARDRKQVYTIGGVSLGVMTVYNFVFGKVLSMLNLPGAVEFFKDTDTQNFAVPILGLGLGYLASKWQNND